MKKIIITILSIILLVGLISEAFLVSAVPTGKDSLEKITFIHYKDGKVKAIDHNAKPGTNTCYKLMGIKWNTPSVNYAINPTNDDGLSEEFVTSAISTSAETWDAATTADLFGTYSIDNSAQYGILDDKNAIVFGEYSGSSNVIAVTSVWYYRGSRKTMGQIVEFDMLFNTQFIWGNVDDTLGVMDLQNIATHELGHSVGLADLYNSCISETMYGYSWEGDIGKRDLNSGDISGLIKIYGY